MPVITSSYIVSLNFPSCNCTRGLDYQPLFGKEARVPPRSIVSGRNVDWIRESGGNPAYSTRSCFFNRTLRRTINWNNSRASIVSLARQKDITCKTLIMESTSTQTFFSRSWSNDGTKPRKKEKGQETKTSIFTNFRFTGCSWTLDKGTQFRSRYVEYLSQCN